MDISTLRSRKIHLSSLLAHPPAVSAQVRSMESSAASGVRKYLPVPLKRFLRRTLRIVADRATLIDRSLVAGKYLRGNGVEIGALHSPLKVPSGARVRYLDRMSREDLRRQYPELASLPLVEPDILDDGERLARIPDASLDFLIANHFLEHCENPILALRNMLRVLRSGGILYLGVPDKRFTFDHERPVTPVEHLLRDYEEGPSCSRKEHFTEWVRHVQKVSDEQQIERNVADLEAINFSIHFHVWTQQEILELLQVLQRKFHQDLDLELFLKNGLECILVIRKLGKAAVPEQNREDRTG